MVRTLVLVASLTVQAVAAVAFSTKRPTVLRNCGPFLSQTAVRVWPAASRKLPTHPAGIVSATRIIDGRPYGVAVARNGTTYVALIGTSLLQRGDLGSKNLPIQSMWARPLPTWSSTPREPAPTRLYRPAALSR